MLIPAGSDALLTGTQAAKVARVSVQAIVNWRNRGWLEPAGLCPRGYPLYRKADLWAALQRPTVRRRRVA